MATTKTLLRKAGHSERTSRILVFVDAAPAITPPRGHQGVDQEIGAGRDQQKSQVEKQRAAAQRQERPVGVGIDRLQKEAAGAADKIPIVEQHASQLGKRDGQQCELDAANGEPAADPCDRTAGERRDAAPVRIAIHGLSPPVAVKTAVA